MKHIVNFLGGALLGVGSIGSLLVSEQFLFDWVVIILLLAILVSLALGAYWASGLKKIDLNYFDGKTIDEAIEVAMRGELRWLQGIRPRGNLVDLKMATATSLMELVSKRYMSSSLLGIAIVGGGALISIGIDPFNGHGIFGALLATSLGRAIAIAIALYLLLSSASAYFLGLFLSKSKGGEA